MVWSNLRWADFWLLWWRFFKIKQWFWAAAKAAINQVSYLSHILSSRKHKSESEDTLGRGWGEGGRRNGGKKKMFLPYKTSIILSVIQLYRVLLFLQNPYHSLATKKKLMCSCACMRSAWYCEVQQHRSHWRISHSPFSKIEWSLLIRENISQLN